MILKGALCLTLCAFVLICPPAASAEVGVDLGVQYGFDADSGEEFFHYYGLAGAVESKDFWEWGSGWSVDQGLTLTAGGLHAGSDDGFFAAIGPRIDLNLPGGWLTVTASVRAGGMTDHRYGDEDLGGWFTFAEDIGVRWNISPEVSVGYLFQHISNANVYDENPGVEFHIIEVRYHF
jgi:hypothetical protein